MYGVTHDYKTYGRWFLLMDILSILIGIVFVAVFGLAILILKHKTDIKLNERDEVEIEKEVYKSRTRLQEGDRDVINLMINNVSELREYYVISKRQANRAFSSTLMVCVLGFIIFAAGIVASIFSNRGIMLYTTISGSIIEIISGLFLVLYRNTIAQLNLYHERLGATEKYLTAMQLAEMVSLDNRDDLYRYIIEVMLIDNSSVTRKNKLKDE